jgi:hypothetical protein
MRICYQILCSASADTIFLKKKIYNSHFSKRQKIRSCLVHPKNQKLFKISRHIESYGIYMKH